MPGIASAVVPGRMYCTLYHNMRAIAFVAAYPAAATFVALLCIAVRPCRSLVQSTPLQQLLLLNHYNNCY